MVGVTFLFSTETRNRRAPVAFPNETAQARSIPGTLPVEYLPIFELCLKKRHYQTDPY